MLTGDPDGRLLGIPHEVILDPTYGATCHLGIDTPGPNSLGLHICHADTPFFEVSATNAISASEAAGDFYDSRDRTERHMSITARARTGGAGWNPRGDRPIYTGHPFTQLDLRLARRKTEPVSYERVPACPMHRNAILSPHLDG
ncbi:hypothetical protein GCM10010176_096410 [Nonomuraea spiralis]|nr:hypothetical protein GCM10010176_096410 [Nonomuraea spiralis]